MASWTKGTPSMTSAKYISQSLFSSNSNPGYSGFALWRDRALRSPEIAIAHLSQGLRSSYHGKRGSFEFLSLQYAWRSWCTVNIEVWGALGVALPPQALWQAQRTCNLPSNILSHDFYLPATADSRTSAALPRRRHPKRVYTIPPWEHSLRFVFTNIFLNGYDQELNAIR